KHAMPGIGELIEMTGPDGSFGLAQVGGNPELENAFLYADEKYRFFFYADLVARSGRAFDIVVKHASTGHFEGGRPRIPEHDLRRIESNIAMFFSARRFTSIRKLISHADQRPRRVAFAWKLPS